MKSVKTIATSAAFVLALSATRLLKALSATAARAGLLAGAQSSQLQARSRRRQAQSSPPKGLLVLPHQWQRLWLKLYDSTDSSITAPNGNSVVTPPIVSNGSATPANSNGR